MKQLLIVGAIVLGFLGFSEYQRLKISLAASQTKIDSLAAEIQDAAKSARTLIDDLHKKLFGLESQISKLAGSQPQESDKPNEASEDKLEQEPRVVMHSGAGCAPCVIWKRNHMPAWQRQGWTVEIIDETSTTKSWPWFEIFEDGQRYEVVGMLTIESLSRAKNFSGGKP